MTGAHKKYVSQFSMMGTVITITLFAPNQPIVEALYNYLATMDRVFSMNRPDSELMAINRHAGQHPVAVSPICFDLIQRAVTASQQQATSFNVLMGPVVKLWRIGFGGQTVPEQAAIDQALALTDPNAVVLDAAQHSVYLTHPGMMLDLGAIAKGYFADQMIGQLQAAGIDQAIVNLGGNVKLLGCNPTTPTGQWTVGIQAPKAPRGYPALQVVTTAKTVVTSGIFERYFRIGNRVYHHILDPQTGYPVARPIEQVSILTTNSEYAEILSTVAFFKGVTAGVNYINQLPQVEAIFIDHQQQIHTTAGLQHLSEGVYQYE
ncbi:FAD:protein FMN transferase [Lactiplantibacillus daowaiensis]|uniref:FAD:protein FMN transferase n=1 Tax=Lactiplantibacillus daowaiensis TaxID=2559918 RepID=A0ABW1RZ09_9LACO|nr:FAD:protein FMN transferase [Lactiplantibacillus daowaiensis]